MNPRLVATAGLLTGSVFKLEGEVSIGRETYNQICISDPLVSRRHCVVAPSAEGFRVRDLNSFNGTLVNGVPVEEQALKHFDRVTVGGTQFLFLSADDEPSEGDPGVEFDNAELPSRATIRPQMGESLYLDPERAQTSPVPALRVARNLSTLLKIGAALNSVRDLKALQHQVVESLFAVVPADHGAILLGDPAAGAEFASVFALNREPEDARALRLSRTIVRQVMETGAAVTCNDVLHQGEWNAARSLLTSQTTSVLCVPLAVFGRVVGALYLSTARPAERFDDEHLELTAAVASMAAVAIENVRRLGRVEAENQRLQADLQVEHNMVGKSPKMREVFAVISKVAATDSTTLISGESGTGKELAARAIYRNGARSGGPFVTINCAAITETLLESELFGHEKGAFTGASAQKKGKMELADGGTVFLDEVGELAPTVQAKLLRVLQERELERVGGTRQIKVDIRVIAATNRDLAGAVRDGSFRADLFYRLNVVTLTMPPLRERREDIPLLAQQFIAKHGGKCSRRVRGVSPEAEACMLAYDWPGNVRELENAVERAVVLGSADLIMREDLPDDVAEARPAAAGGAAGGYHEAVLNLKRKLVLDTFAQAGGVHNEAARLLGVHPNNLYRIIRSLGLWDSLKS
ncbi:MAG TPA: sigma 54-interacting transcriptional regulator [Pyrinomonadaceae bacterium]|jgi:Nif-specific regulatory protein